MGSGLHGQRVPGANQLSGTPALHTFRSVDRDKEPREPLSRPQPEPQEARLRHVRVADDFVTIPLPRLAAALPAGGARSDRQVAAAVSAYQREAAVVDDRLARLVTVRVKGTSLSDLCEQLRAGTGIQLIAGPSVADEKVTVFCEKTPLRDLMRQLSRPFGYAWLRSGTAAPSPRGRGEPHGREPGPRTEPPPPPLEDGAGGRGSGFRYELAQDLKSQLLEEELRNRDRNAALLDMEEEAKRYRAYLDLSPEEALARAATAAPEEKEILQHYAGKGWGPAQLYFRLTPAELSALRAGETVTFSAAPGPGEKPLLPELAESVIASLRDYRIVRRGDRLDAGPAKHVPDGQAVSAFPDARPIVSLQLVRSELGEIRLQGLSGFSIGAPPDGLQLMGDGERNLATGISPAVRSPRNAVVNAALALDPDLQARMSVRPGTDLAPAAGVTTLLSPGGKGGQGKAGSPKTNDLPSPPSPSGGGAGAVVRPITTADVLEAIHRATRLCVVSDYYTRLLRPEELAVQEQSRFEAISRLADAMRMRWQKDGKWLQFRTSSYFHDRLKEVPNRLLERWAAARRRNSALTLEEMVEIAQLSDAQLDSGTMAEGARVLYGLVEWDLARSGFLRPHWRYLAGFPQTQRQSAQEAGGLPFRQMSLGQQQRFLALVLDAVGGRLESVDDLAAGGLRIQLVPPLGFQLSGTQTTTPFEHGIDAPRIWGATREAALQAARRIDPGTTEAQIVPAELSVTFTYRLGGPNARLTPMVVHADAHNVISRRPQPVPGKR
jgi:hypothetical protein